MIQFLIRCHILQLTAAFISPGSCAKPAASTQQPASRICIGEQFAWMEAILVLATLMQH